MNYTIEDNLCFLEELAKTLKVNPVEEKEVCLISGAELEKKYVTLNCGHKFNYKDIYNEVVYQKKTTRITWCFPNLAFLGCESGLLASSCQEIDMVLGSCFLV